LTGTRLSTRTELKENIMDIYSSINGNRPFETLGHVDSAELNVTVYFNTRGRECSHLIPILERIRNLLRKNPTMPVHKRQIYEYLFEFSNALRATSMSQKRNSDGVADPLLSLKDIAEDLIDDYSSFNPTTSGQELVEQNRKILELIKDDLMEMRELEVLFKKQPDILKAYYNLLLKEIHKCLMILPHAKDITLSANTAKIFRTNFETLFAVLSDMLMPIERPEAKTVDDEDVEKPVEKKKTVKQAPKKEAIDLSELERKAKEGLLNGGSV
jgi:hypothetical protein